MSTRVLRQISSLLNLIVILAMMFASPLQSAVKAYTDTDRPEYEPGSTVTIFGDNRDGAGYLPGETVRVTVTQPVLPDPLVCEAVADEAGAWSCEVELSAEEELAVGDYSYTTLGLESGVSETHFFSDAQPPDLEQLWQCDPPSVFDPATYTCVNAGSTGWVTGNNNGPYMEGDTVPYRTRLKNLVIGNQYSVTIAWDTTKSSKHAIDYLKTYNATVLAADACISLGGLPAGLCSGAPNTYAIPADSFMQSDANWVANGGIQDPGNLIMFGGTITSLSAYAVPPSYDDNTSTSITVYFTASSTDVVLAWGGHIAERDDWGLNQSAVNISGSPYHMSISTWYDITNDVRLNVGDLDRSLSAEAIIYPGSITIIKQATPEGSTAFPFSASPTPLANFSLIDDGTPANTIVFSNISEFKVYTVTENTPSGWTFAGASCIVTSSNGGSQTVVGPTATINLKEGENVTCTYTNTRNYDQDLSVTKTAAASFGRLYKWTIDKSVDDTLIEIAEGGTTAFHYSVKVTPDGYTDSAWEVKGKITVSNPNAFAVSGVNVTDSINNGGVCAVTGGTNVTVPASGNVVLDYTCTFAAAPSPAAGVNTATATWTAEALYSPHTSANGTADIDFSTTSPVETNKTITVIDDKTDPLHPVTLGTWNWADGEHTFTYTLEKPGVAGTCTDYTNTAVIDETKQSDQQKVTVCVGRNLTVLKTASASKDRLYKWTIDKSVDDTLIEIAEGGTAVFHYSVKVTPNGYTDSGWTLGGTITIGNPNDWEDITVSVTDTLDAGGTCSITETAPYVVPKSDSLVLHYTCSTNGSTTKNTATVTWNKTLYFTPLDTASDDADVVFGLNVETNKTITVIDDKTDPLHPVTLGTWNWADGEHTFTYTLEKPGVAGTCTDYTNTAVIDETKQSDQQKVTICVGRNLAVEKTAIPSFTRTWTWTITKDYEGSYSMFPGDNVPHGYKVTVSPTSTDSLWKVVGVITINNPNDWEAITLTSLGDSVDNGGNCVVDAGPYVIEAGSKLDVNYTCTWAAMPSSYNGTNTANAAWDKALHFTPLGTASGQKAFEFTNPTEINPVITVDDDNLTGENWTANRAYGEWTYSKDFTCSTDAKDYTDGKYSYSHTNTAKIVETKQSDDAKVDVTCYWPQIDITKNGDTLSKIGDKVYYDITLFNNTPVAAGMRALSCTITDALIGFNKTVTLASGAKDENLDIEFTIPKAASDPFENTVSVTCKPVAATEPVVGSSSFSVSDNALWSTNLFQPKLEIIKSGPAGVLSGETITYTFTINNLSSLDSPHLILDSVTDDVLGDLIAPATAAGCGDLAFGGTCTFTKDYPAPEVEFQAVSQKNIVTVHYHPYGYPNDITDTDDHTVIIMPKGQFTDTSYCPLPNNQFRLLYQLDIAPNIYRLTASNPGQFYYNAFYTGTPGSPFTMTIQVPYPFVTQEGAGNPIQVHDGTGLTAGGCYLPYPGLNGFTILTQALTPTSPAGYQIITLEDYNSLTMGSHTVVTVSGTVPATGFVYVTIHLDYSLKKTSSWKPTGTSTENPVTGLFLPDMRNGLGSGPVTIHGLEAYHFEYTVGGDTAFTNPASINEVKKFAGFMGFVTNAANGNPMKNVKIQIRNPLGLTLATLYTDSDGYYMLAYKHKARSATYTIRLPEYDLIRAVTIKANGFSVVNFEVGESSLLGSSGEYFLQPKVIFR